MKIISTGKDGQRPYRLMDDCPRCSGTVAAFQVDYGMTPDFSWGEPVWVPPSPGPTLTLQPCGCTLPMNDVKWNIYQFDTKANWNKEVVTHELRNRAKEDRKGV